MLRTSRDLVRGPMGLSAGPPGRPCSYYRRSVNRVMPQRRGSAQPRDGHRRRTVSASPLVHVDGEREDEELLLVVPFCGALFGVHGLGQVERELESRGLGGEGRLGDVDVEL